MAALETALARLQNRLVRAPAPATAPAAAPAPLLTPSDVPTPPIVSAPAPSPAPTADRSIQSILSVLPSYQIDTPVRQEPRVPQPFQVYNQVVIQQLPPTPVPARPFAPVVAYKPPSRMPLLSSTLPSYPSCKPQLGATYPTPPKLAATPQRDQRDRHVSPYHLIPTPTVAVTAPPPAHQQHDQVCFKLCTIFSTHCSSDSHYIFHFNQQRPCFSSSLWGTIQREPASTPLHNQGTCIKFPQRPGEYLLATRLSGCKPQHSAKEVHLGHE